MIAREAAAYMYWSFNGSEEEEERVQLRAFWVIERERFLLAALGGMYYIYAIRDALVYSSKTFACMWTTFERGSMGRALWFVRVSLLLICCLLVIILVCFDCVYKNTALR